MKNMKFWRTALVAALVLTVMLSVTGGTIAWFTDEVTSGDNKIQAGKLDVQLLMYDGSEYVDISESDAPIFGADSSTAAQNKNADTLWEPGKTQVAYLAIRNNGNLALKYKVSLEVEEETDSLSKAMLYAITPDADDEHPVTAWDKTNAKKVEAAQQDVSGDVSLAVGATHYFALSIHMDEDAGNEYQNGSVEFDITVYATQDDVESDSFGTDYDENATYPDEEPKKVLQIPDVVTQDTEMNGLGYESVNEYEEVLLKSGDLTLKNITFKNGLTIYTNANTEGTVTLENCTIYLHDGSDNPNYNMDFADYGLYIGAISKDVSYVFKNCTFTADEGHVYTNADNSSYNVYIGGNYSADSITFENCTFEKSGKHGIGCSYAYSTDANNPFTYYDLTVTGCHFVNWNNNNQNGAAVRGNVPEDVLTTYHKSITISNNTFGDSNNSNKANVAIDSWNGAWN